MQNHQPIASQIRRTKYVLTIVLFGIILPSATLTGQALWQDFAKRAETSYRAGKYADSYTQYTQAIGVNPKEALLYLGRGEARFQMRDFQGAVEDFSEAIRLKAAPVAALSAAYCSRGAAYMNMQNFDEAMRDFTESARLNPKNFTAFFDRGILKGLRNELVGAIDDFSKAAKLNARVPQLYYERGNVYIRQQQQKKAIEDYSQAIRLNPSFADAFANRAAAFGSTNEPENAETDLTKLLELRPKDALAYFNRGTARVMLKNYTGAVEDFTKSLELEPSRTNALLNRASAKHSLKDYRGAVEDLTTVLKNNPQDIQAFLNSTSFIGTKFNQEKFNNAFAYTNRAQYRLDMGDTLGALQDWRKAADLGYLNASAAPLKNAIKAPVFESSEELPSSLQLFPRDKSDSAVVRFAGTLYLTAFDTAFVVVRKNGAVWKRLAQPLRYEKAGNTTKAAITIEPKIKAELSLYGFDFGVKSATRDTLLVTCDSVVCGDVLLVNGQSNVFLGDPMTIQNAVFARTFKYGHLDNSWRVANAANEDGMGGVGAVALRLAENLIAKQNVPVCIINGSIPASTSEQHQRDSAQPLNPYTLYGRMLLRARRAGISQAARAMVWYQGESDGAEKYADRFAALHKAWREDYPNLEKIFAVQIRPSDCAQADQARVRELQRRLPETFSNLTVIASAGIGTHDGCHFKNDGYKQLADRLTPLIERDVYKVKSTATNATISSPTIRKAYFADASKTAIVLEFAGDAMEKNSPELTILKNNEAALKAIPQSALAMFFFNGEQTPGGITAFASGVALKGNTIIIYLKSPMSITDVSYMPDTFPFSESNKSFGKTAATTESYQGPWLASKQGVAALAFYRVAVQDKP